LLSLSSHDTAPTEIYALSLHDALPISETFSRPALAGAEDEAGPLPPAHPQERPASHEADRKPRTALPPRCQPRHLQATRSPGQRDRKSTRLNSSHVKISYAVFCLKKKK